MHVTLDHPNIVHFVGFCLDPPCLAVEFCHQGSIEELLRTAVTRAASPIATLTWQRLLALGADAAAGMQYLHSQSPVVVHGDLKSSNLLITSDWSVRVSDIGIRRLVDAAGPSVKNGAPNGIRRSPSPRWMAPEVMQGRRVTPAADVYSFGVIMWELLTWQMPWSNVKPWSVSEPLLKQSILTGPFLYPHYDAPDAYGA